MKNHLNQILVLIALVSFAPLAQAKSQSKLVEYKDGDTLLEGVSVVELKHKGRSKGGVLVVHNWMGIGEHTRSVAEKLAAQGYHVFLADIYGKGVRPANAEEASKLAGKYKSDRRLLRSRVRAALDTLQRESKIADASKVVAIGYCFGGTTVLELARSGAPVGGVVSFHGGLDSPTPGDGKNIRSKVLVLHGAADPYVPQKDIDAFLKELNDAKVDWQMVSYAGAVHAFTEPGAGNDPSKGAAYDAKADSRSWSAFQAFLAEVLKK